MEIVLTFLALVGALFLAFKFGRSDNRDSRSPAKPTSQPPLGRQTLKAARPVQPPRFEEKSAKHLHHKRILTGAAYVIDGDTIKIKKTQVRLFGIDAPELNHPYGKKAKWALHKLCKGHIVTAEITDEDHYGRTVARCYLIDGRDLSAEMVKQGLAIDWPKCSGGKYRKLETADARKKLFLADARQKGHMYVWEKFEAQ